MLRFDSGNYDETEFAYESIVSAWQAINGLHSEGRYLFIGRLRNPMAGGAFMAYLIRPERDSSDNLIVPFDYDGFREEADADEAIQMRARDLDWRIREIEKDAIHDL